jgi:hypothetical protein
MLSGHIGVGPPPAPGATYRRPTTATDRQHVDISEKPFEDEHVPEIVRPVDE